MNDLSRVKYYFGEKISILQSKIGIKINIKEKPKMTLCKKLHYYSEMTINI